MLILGQANAHRLQMHGEEGYPQEVCGLLVGNFGGGKQVRRIHEVHRARNLNLERAADRYDLDPSDYRRIEEDARSRGLEVVGIYHSHPDHPSRPSETDRLRAEELWQETESWSYLILEVASGKVVSRRSWILRGGRFEEEPIEEEPIQEGFPETGG